MGSLNVHVTYESSGAGKHNVRVVGENSNGMTSPAFTDRNGHTCISWVSSTNTLTSMYINGKRHKGRFTSGQTYAFSAR